MAKDLTFVMWNKVKQLEKRVKELEDKTKDTEDKEQVRMAYIPSPEDDGTGVQIWAPIVRQV